LNGCQESTEFLSQDEVAEIIRLSPETLAQWRWLRNEIPFIRLGTKCVRYRQCDLDAWIEKRLVWVEFLAASDSNILDSCHAECQGYTKGQERVSSRSPLHDFCEEVSHSRDFSTRIFKMGATHQMEDSNRRVRAGPMVQ
jgi:predicted DNA-binding transcriptional regulator AlpA